MNRRPESSPAGIAARIAFRMKPGIGECIFQMSTHSSCELAAGITSDVGVGGTGRRELA